MESSREELIIELQSALQDQDAPGALGSPHSLLCSLALGFPARVVCLSVRKPTQSFHGFSLFSSLSISVHRCHPLFCVSVFHSSDFSHSGYRDNERNIGISGWFIYRWCEKSAYSEDETSASCLDVCDMRPRSSDL